MTERAHLDRPISAAEAAVLRAALERVPKAPEFASLASGIERLRVVGACTCGCDSIDFLEQDPARRVTLVADGIGTTPAGGQVGVIVWGTKDFLSGLEVYDLGAGDDDIKLPVPTSIRGFHEGAA